MNTMAGIGLNWLDYTAFAAYFVSVYAIGLYAGRRKGKDSGSYFLASHALPWYIVGSSFIASNISSEQFLGMVGSAYVYGISPAFFEWGNVLTFTLIIWLFIPFLLASKVFTTPEYMETRFNPLLRQFFAIVTVITDIVAFLAAVLYGGAVALQGLFGWDQMFSIVAIGTVAGSLAIYGGLSSVAWTDLITVIVMIVGGILVTVFGLYDLSGDSHSLVQGFQTLLTRNQAQTGEWAQAVAQHAHTMTGQDTYNRLALFQPMSHVLTPWPLLILGVFSLSIWYNVCNQFMIQRVLAARDMYHARMGIVFAGYMKVVLPFIVVLPGLILFAKDPSILQLPWEQVQPEADKSYVRMLQMLIPAGIRGVFLAALYGAIQSTVNAVLNSTATIFTLDIYKRMIRPKASEKDLVLMGRISTVVILVVAMILACFINRISGSLFVYIQTLYAFFAPPFGAVFLLGILFRRINGKGATAGVFAGFGLGIAMKLYVQFVPDAPAWLVPFGMQGIINWAFCTLVCVAVSLATAPPRPEQVTSQLTLDWRRLNIFAGLGTAWYTNVVLWWGLFVTLIAGLFLGFSGLFL